ncbi:M20 family metallopeptidase [Paenarthrobacter sp. DKR-5]|uniref:M20 metallopeptidase family protein n=1 Tax=Paenarthrobacter sp. DKR-5 TaxID=2835535 RepID=UPI0027DE9CCC|nr:M20 family metallopeptidase [Paenarthrobacter sp. DKR-5]
MSDLRELTRTQELAAELAPELSELRRELHKHPELGNDLPLTQRRVLQALEGLDLEISTGRSLSSVTAVLRGGAPAAGAERPVVLLRGDMDALPVAEDNDLDYKSAHEGLMHACGHDLHVAGLVGAARILHALKDELAGDVIFMFQPGEEGPGGAAPMIEEGLLEAAGRRPDAAFGLHVFSEGRPRGVWFGRPGSQMASADELHVRFLGAGGHGSQPHLAKDPVPALCEAVTALQTMVTRQFDVFDPVVLTVGKIAAGTRDNIIPSEALFEATVRSFSKEARAKIREASIRVVEGVAATHGLDAVVDYHDLYPVTSNEASAFALARQTIEDLFGEDRFREMENPEPGSEDFSFVANEVPAAYLFLSACAQEDPSAAASNHSAHALFDDSVLPDAASWLAEVAIRRLSQGI